MNNWQTTLDTPWGGSDKFQDPIDINCDGEWTGFAARFARRSGQLPEFFPNKNARLWQIVGPVNSNNNTLYFHSLFVAHRVNQYKAEIFGANSLNGPWISLWTPFNIENCLSKDCVNSPYNQFCMHTRICLWDYIAKEYLGSLDPISKNISQGYSYYKIEFLMNYPPPDPDTATGDVGGKLSRVYFSVGNEANPTPTSNQSTNTPTPTTHPRPISTADPTPSQSSPTPVSETPGDADGDGDVDGVDFSIWLSNFNTSTYNGASDGDFNGDRGVDGVDFSIWLNNFGTGS